MENKKAWGDLPRDVTDGLLQDLQNCINEFPDLAPLIVIEESRQVAVNILSHMKNLDEVFVFVELDKH